MEVGLFRCLSADSQYGADYSGTPPSGPPNGANPLFSGGCTPGTGAKNQATNCGYQFGDSQKSLPAWYVKDITQVQCGEMAQQIVDCTNLPSALQDPRYIGLIKDTKGVPSGAYGSWSIFLKAMDITAFTSFGISIQTLGPPSSSAKCVSAAKAMGNWEKVHKRANPPSYLVEALSECAN